jgi:hypothetical protein
MNWIKIDKNNLYWSLIYGNVYYDYFITKWFTSPFFVGTLGGWENIDKNIPLWSKT